MYIIIVGAGEVGSYLADILVEEGHDVAIVEVNDKLVRQLESRFDALVIQGSGVSYSTLEQAGIRKADLVLAVTHVDEINLITCMNAAKVNSRARTVARVRHVGYLVGDSALTPREIGVSLLVGPERAVAEEVVSLLGYEGAGRSWPLANDKLRLLELPLADDSPLVHATLSELRSELPEPSLVVGIKCSNELRIPRGADQIKPDERAYILTTPDNTRELYILSGKPWHQVRHVLIIGCGNIGFHLARELEVQHLYPTIIEKDPDRAKFVARNLKNSIVLQGDATDPELLREQLQEVADAVVVLLEDDEKALLVGLFAQHMGASKVIVRSDKRAYAPIGNKMGIDALISPRRAVADAILRFVRRGRIFSSHMIGDHQGEILQLKLPDEPKNTSIIRRPLREVLFPEGSLVCAVVRPEGVVIASGETQLEPGDDVLVVSNTEGVKAIEELLR